MGQQDKERPGKVQVIENRVQLDCLVIEQKLSKSDLNHDSFAIQIETIKPVAGYPDLVSRQNPSELELKIRKDDETKHDNLVGKRISCQVTWAPKNQIFAVKGTMKIFD